MDPTSSSPDRSLAPAALEPPLQLDQLHQLVERAERAVTLCGSVPPVLARHIRTAFAELARGLDSRVRSAHALDAAVLGARVRAALLPYIERAENAHRWYAKPRGYAGDYLSIARIYEDDARGGDPVAKLLDRCFLDLPAARAVQNRLDLVAAEIRATLDAQPGRLARVTSLACGPAREVFDIYITHPDAADLATTLVDFDAAALAHCEEHATTAGIAEQVTLVNANLIHVATGRTALGLAPQDFVYSIGLIDYLPDGLVVQLLDWIHGVLRPGGRVLLGNFHPSNPTKGLLDHVLDWKLVHRDEDDMRALFEASAFGQPCTRFLYEATGINLFAEAVKA